ncbi:ribosome maturation factor RimM [Hyphomicrobium sp. 1Nfss2.1]|uniref:ribosome maturation factor RimM n=1 Tax=Hyphomicrobium sp. 1Nfss2.1 TaxID=3413936 RepID=UPI003C7DC95C
MTDQRQRVLLGRIVTVHGIRGDVVIDSHTGEPADIGAYGPLQSADGAKEFKLKVLRVTPKGVVAHIAGVDDRNGAEALRGTDLYAHRDSLPAAAEGEYYYADLEGLRVDNEAGEALGTVIAVQNYGAGDLLEVKLAGERGTELIPFTDAYVPTVDIPGGRVVVIMPVSTDDEDDEGAPDEAEPA